MRNVAILLLFLALPSPVLAQEVRTYPGVPPLQEGLPEYLAFLQQQQLQSLKLFTTYLAERVEKKAVPEGIFLNAQAIYIEAQVKATPNPAEKREMLAELSELYAKRKQLDADSPNATWFGVDRVELGKMMQTEFETFSKEAERPSTNPKR
ncbi:hypothetical protein [Bremerella cremea]|uniref:hypothetical protein n=1 Tax=Bremerella cremea TaxID=1031537 RepID=UPI0031EAABA4